MRKILIDVGAYNGDSFLQLMTMGYADYESYLIEPNPRFFPVLALLLQKFDNIVQVETAAAWTEDGIKEFSIDKSNPSLGSSLMKSKEGWDNGDIVEIHTFDFSDWLRQFKGQEVIVKLDCEGAEFPILVKMIEEGTITIPKLLMVEFHPNKVAEYTTADKNYLVERIKDLGVNVVEWH